MINKLIRAIFRRFYFWQAIDFKELAELYISRMIRVVAMQMMAGFTTIYLYQLGYSLQYIILAWVFYFTARFAFTPVIAVMIARYGPKHAMLVSNISLIIATIGIVMVPDYKIWGFVIYIIFGSFSRSTYDISYLIDFSKIKHTEHSGKEIGFMQIAERVMSVLAPLLGGLIALLFGPRAMLIFGCILMIVAAMPLFFSAEPVRVKQKITLRHFNYKAVWRSLVANIGIGIDNNISGLIWPIFVAIIILNGKDQAVFIQLGALTAFSTLFSILSAFWYGKMVDKQEGKKLLNFGAIGNILIHMIRPFAATPFNAAAINAVNEIATTAYTLSATRSIFDVADGLPGYRIVYMSLLSAFMVIGDILSTVFVYLAISNLGDKAGMQLTMFILAPTMILISWHGYSMYRRGIFTRFIHRV
jgi:MFS family permease